MELEALLRIAAVVLAGALLLSTVDYGPIWSKVKSWFKRSPKPDVEITTEETSFLEIVESWHTLRHQCDIYGLSEAVEKIDEVFPLLNSEDSEDV
tara:strand:+ start:1403 stop:1687 length:285 start_codon:yes stop_codon:yes gene_type:complete